MSLPGDTQAAEGKKRATNCALWHIEAVAAAVSWASQTPGTGNLGTESVPTVPRNEESSSGDFRKGRSEHSGGRGQTRSTPHLRNLLLLLKQKNSQFSDEKQIQYVVCQEGSDVARALRKHGRRVKMVFFGPGLDGRPVTMARLMSKSAQIVLVVDGTVNSHVSDPPAFKKFRASLESLGIAVRVPNEATTRFFEPLVDANLIKGLQPAPLAELVAAGRAAMIDRRLKTLSKFPSLPETQSRVNALDDMAAPDEWEEAIDPDPVTRAIILKLLNSAHYGFRSKVATIQEAMARAGV